MLNLKLKPGEDHSQSHLQQTHRMTQDCESRAVGKVRDGGMLVAQSGQHTHHIPGGWALSPRVRRKSAGLEAPGYMPYDIDYLW